MASHSMGGTELDAAEGCMVRLGIDATIGSAGCDWNGALASTMVHLVRMHCFDGSNVGVFARPCTVISNRLVVVTRAAPDPRMALTSCGLAKTNG